MGLGVFTGADAVFSTITLHFLLIYVIMVLYGKEIAESHVVRLIHKESMKCADGDVGFPFRIEDYFEDERKKR